MIKRHIDFDSHRFIPLEALETFEGLLSDDDGLYDNMRRNNGGSVMGLYITESLNAVSNSIIADCPKATTLRYLKLAREFGVAHFAQHVRHGETFEVSINGQQITLTGRYKGDYTDSNAWWKTYYTAIVLRDIDAINSLQKVQPKHFAMANVPSSPFDLALVAVLQGLFQQDANMAERLKVALTAEIKGGKAREKRTNHLFIPLLPVIRCIFTPDAEAEFNQVVKEAVKLHKKFWNGDKYDCAGWISLALTALAAIAKARNGWQLDFETDYIPQWLVDGDFS
ncbi:immunity 49 family protein [Shewanella sp.]|uniref:immunity 49 family protein n=1 Tax=Shewanella sp. TaxID=50422 RepID=UPI003A9709F6